MYRCEDRVRFSEIGENGRMKLTAILDVFQDCANSHSAAVGLGADEMAARKRAWLMDFWQVYVERYPREEERYTVETRPWKFDGFFANRNYALYDGEGRSMVRANSIWFYVNTEKMRPVRPKAEDVDPYGTDPCLQMDYAAGRKIAVPERMQAEEPFPVRRANLDVNHHVNNVQYIQMAAEYFPEDLEVYELRTEYDLAAIYGDIICPEVGRSEDGWFVVSLNREDGKKYAVVEVRARG